MMKILKPLLRWFEKIDTVEAQGPLAAYARGHSKAQPQEQIVHHRQFGRGVVRLNSEQVFESLGRFVRFDDAKDIYGNVVDGAFSRDVLSFESVERQAA
jgi:hypothetical protein